MIQVILAKLASPAIIQVILALPGIIKALMEAYSSVKQVGEPAKSVITGQIANLKAASSDLKAKSTAVKLGVKAAKVAIKAEAKKKVNDLTASAKLIEAEKKVILDKINSDVLKK